MLLLPVNLLRTDVVALATLRLPVKSLLLPVDIGVAVDALPAFLALRLALDALLLTLDTLRTLLAFDALRAFLTFNLALNALRTFLALDALRAFDLLTFLTLDLTLDSLGPLDALHLRTFGALDLLWLFLLRPFLALGLLAAILLCRRLLRIITATATLLGRNRGSQCNAGNASDQ